MYRRIWISENSYSHIFYAVHDVGNFKESLKKGCPAIIMSVANNAYANLSKNRPVLNNKVIYHHHHQQPVNNSKSKFDKHQWHYFNLKTWFTPWKSLLLKLKRLYKLVEQWSGKVGDFRYNIVLKIQNSAFSVDSKSCKEAHYHKKTDSNKVKLSPKNWIQSGWKNFQGKRVAACNETFQLAKSNILKLLIS